MRRQTLNQQSLASFIRSPDAEQRIRFTEIQPEMLKNKSEDDQYHTRKSFVTSDEAKEEVKEEAKGNQVTFRESVNLLDKNSTPIIKE